MAMNGADVLLLVNTGTDAAPTWTAVGSQRNVTFTEERDMIDVSTKESPNRRVIPGRYSATVELESLYVPDDNALTLLRTAIRQGTKVQVMRQEASNNVEKAYGYISNREEEMPDQAECTVSVTVEIDDGWTPAA